jgi:hypothetical protein
MLTRHVISEAAAVSADYAVKRGAQLGRAKGNRSAGRHMHLFCADTSVSAVIHRALAA